MSEEQLKAKLSLYAGTLPSTVLDDLFQTLKAMGLTESKVDEIIERTIKTYSGQDSSSRMDEIVEKMNNLEDTLIRALKTIESKQGLPAEQEEPEERVSAKRGTPEPEELEEPAAKEPDEGFPRVPTGQRVLLADVPDTAISNAVMLKWVEFLLETVGHQNLPIVLDYYVDIGWISERVTMKLLAYASGMVAPRGRAKERLSTKDHLR